MKDLLIATTYICLLAGAGSTIGRWILSRSRDPDREPLGWGWSYLIGVATTGLFLYCPIAVRGRVPRGYFIAAACVCLLLTVVGLWRGFSLRTIVPTLRRAWIFDLPWPIASVVACVFLAGAASVALTEPTSFDGRATFALKAKLLYDVGTIRGEDFQDVERIHFNAHYPLLIPLQEATIFRLQGSMNDRHIRILFFGFLLAVGSIVARELRRSQSRRFAALAAAALICTPLILNTGEGGGLTSSVDLPLACFVTAGAIACMNWLRTKEASQAVLAALMLGAGALTKSEGTLWVAMAGASMLILVLFRRVPLDRTVLKSCAGGILLLVAMLAVLMAVRRQIPYSPYLRSYAAALHWEWLRQLWRRPFAVAGYALYDTSWPGYWNFIWLCIPAALVLRRRVKVPVEVLFSRILVALLALTFCAIFVVTPYHVYWQMATAMHRLTLQLMPLAWLIAIENLAASGWIEKFAGLWKTGDDLPASVGFDSASSVAEFQPVPLRRAS
jgi:hypothetical protein